MSKALTFSKQSGGNIEHNNRTEKRYRDNIDKSRTKNNITLVNIPIKNFYEQEFGEAVKKYNEKQKRSSRKIGSYLEKVQEDKQLNEFYEIVVQIGDMYDTNCKDNPLTEIELLKKYVSDFQVRYPNLKVFNAVIHLDEETPHLHLNYVPITENCKTGIEKQNSQTKAFAEIFPEMKGSGKAHEKFLEVERNNIGALMKTFDIEQTPPEKSHGNLSVAQYKVAAKIGTKMAEKFIDQINKKKLDMNFKKVPLTGQKIITDTQIENINNKFAVKDKVIEDMKMKIEELTTGIEKAIADKEKFMKNNLSKKYVTQEILITELEKELDKVKEEIQEIKNTPNAELIAANEMIQKLQLAAKNKEDLRIKELAEKEKERISKAPEREKRKEFQDNKNIRLEKYDNHFIAEINKEGTKILEKTFEDVPEGSNIREDKFTEIFDKLLDRLKETFKDFVDLFEFKTIQGGNRDLIETEVDILKEKYEDRYNIIIDKSHSKQR